MLLTHVRQRNWQTNNSLHIIKRPDLYVLGAALILSLVVAAVGSLNPERSHTADTDSYIRPAQNLVTRGVFSQLDPENRQDSSLHGGYLTVEGIPRIVATKPPYDFDAFRTQVIPCF